MNVNTIKEERGLEKPICVGLTCWFWQRPAREISEIAERLGVTLEVSQRFRGVYRRIDCRVSGKNVDRFIGEFVRDC
ncbi:MAG: hypothetical protein ABL994_20775 [Verrucomicrobiales bacterium]